jgi:hypothetical protein
LIASVGTAYFVELVAMSFLLDEEKTWIQRDFGLDRRLIKALSKLGFILISYDRWWDQSSNNEITSL